MSEAYLSLWRWAADSPPAVWALSHVRHILLQAMKQGPIPRHIAFEMDGNRRYARNRRMEAIEGHGQGFIALGKALDTCWNLGVKVVTVFAFAVENFSRPKYEVDALMEMAKVTLEDLTNEGELLDRYSVRVRILGERHLIRKDLLEYVDRAVERTKHNTEAVFNICFPYGSREEMTAAVQATVEEYLQPLNPQSAPFSQYWISCRLQSRHVGDKEALPTIHDESPESSQLSDGDDGVSTSTTLSPGSPAHHATSSNGRSTLSLEERVRLPNPEKITAETLGRHMYVAEDPPLDIFIRTSGVERLSNFLLWQCHQDTHIFFLRNYWPEFDFQHFFPVLLEWQWRQKQQARDEQPGRKKRLATD